MDDILNGKKLDNIIKNTIKSVENSKNEIFDISETARVEAKNAQDELIKMKVETLEAMNYLEFLEEELNKAKVRLFEVNKNFQNYTEQELQKAYEEADKLLVQVTILREKEKSIIQRRNDMEVRHKDATKMADKADKLISQVGVVFDYLSGNLKDIGDKIDGIQQKQVLGIRVIKAQEEERQRVAREIHDGPAQLMSNIVLKAEICEKLIDIDIIKTKTELNNLKKIVRDSLQDVRRIIYDLRPMSLDDLGLVPTVSRYASNFSETNGINIKVSSSGNIENLKPIVRLTAFRVIQESLNNIKKHSKASNVTIHLESNDTQTDISIIDDGIGFDTTKKKDSTNIESGFGLFSMKERINLLSGKIEIISESGKGTTVKVSIPNDIEEEI